MVTRKSEYISGGLWVAASSPGLNGRVSMRTFVSLLAAAPFPHCIGGFLFSCPWDRSVFQGLLLFPNSKKRVSGCLARPSLVSRGSLRMLHFGMPL